MTKLILFDLGNVLLHYNHQQVETAVLALCRRPRKAMTRDTAVIHDLGNGKMDGPTFYNYLVDHAGLTASYADFVAAFCVQPSRDEAALATAVALQQRPGIQVGIISNTNVIHSDWLHRHLPELKQFAPVILSNEVGLLKPDAAIYRLALSQAGVPAENAIFIDDLAKNVAAARQLGMAAIHHTDWEATTPILQAWLDR